MNTIVGIDFGTTNVRVAHWSRGSGQNPSTALIGSGGATTMPAVMAFQRRPGGDVTTVIGEEADVLTDGPDVRVVRNVKRWVTSSDPYNRLHLEWRLSGPEDPWPTWWDPDSNSIRIWNKTIPAEEAIRMILKEALSRAGLSGLAAEWRAGCPVNSDLSYRKALVCALDELDCIGRIQWVTEEPLLVLALGLEIGSLQDGSYLVYDLGGGSFDCALVEIAGNDMSVYSEEGLPTLGGMNIDAALKEKLDYSGRDHTLRVAKEQLSTNPAEPIPLPGGISLTSQVVNEVLEDGQFIQKTLAVALDAYKKAKLLWRRGRPPVTPPQTLGAPPMGENIGEVVGSSISSQGALDPVLPPKEGVLGRGVYRSVWSLRLEDMAHDIDYVILVGGPTQWPYFSSSLSEIFGKEKVLTVEALVPGLDSRRVFDPALTALSHGACYMHGKQYVPITIDRVPANITLRVVGGESEDTYEAYQKLGVLDSSTSWTPVKPYVGKWLTTPVGPGRYWYNVSIDTPDGSQLYGPISGEMRMPRNQGPARLRADRIRLIVDVLGSVWVELGTGRPESSGTRARQRIVEHPAWQTATQRKLIRQLWEEQREYEIHKAAQLHRSIHGSPFGWQSDVG